MRSQADIFKKRDAVSLQRPHTGEKDSDYIEAAQNAEEEGIRESDIRSIEDTKFIGHEVHYLILWNDASRCRSWEAYSKLKACNRSVARYHKQDPFAIPP